MMQIRDVAPVFIAAPADHVWLQPFAHIGMHGDEGSAIGRNHPLVGVHGEEIRLNRGEIEFQGAGALGAVEIDDDAALAQVSSRSQLGQGRRPVV